MVMKISSREFNQDTGSAKKAAERGPVIITDRGRPSHVLMSFSEYQRLAGTEATFLESLGSPDGVEDIEFEAPRAQDPAVPARLD